MKPIAESKHTPGPWAVDLKGPFTLGGDMTEVVAVRGNMVERQICSCMLDTDSCPNGAAWLEDAANAKLITIAPDMYEALKWYASSHRPEDYVNDNGERAAKVLESLKNL